MRKLVTRFAKNEEGASLVEYGMLVGLIAVVCLVSVTALGVTVSGVFASINASLSAALAAA
jgi:pilus assembly protein Flp/PilA